jgi:hypothetical protein
MDQPQISGDARMKKQQPKKFDFAKGKVCEVDASELLRFRKAVRDEVVKPIQERAAEQKAAIARARARYVR